jgi:hypothetical protein
MTASGMMESLWSYEKQEGNQYSVKNQAILPTSLRVWVNLAQIDTKGMVYGQH